MKIVVDYRERPSGIIAELGRLGFDVEVKALILADFVLKTKDSEGNLQTVGIERKTQEDFLASIVDKRLVKQLMDLKEQFSMPLLIIEGDANVYMLRQFHPNAIRGMLIAIALDLQVPVIYSRNVRDTASIIATVAKRLEKPHRDISLMQKRRPTSVKEQQEFLVESLPGVGAKLAKSLLKEFGSVRAVFLASVDDLQRVEKIGKKKASQIRLVIDTQY